jgi:hypothetical protein
LQAAGFLLPKLLFLIDLLPTTMEINMNQPEGLFELNIKASDMCIKDGLIERISKAKALANIATSEDFLENFDKDIRNYLWVLSDILNELDELISLLALRNEKAVT